MKEKKMRVVIEKEISTINTGFYTIVWLSEQLAFKLSSRSRFDDGMKVNLTAVGPNISRAHADGRIILLGFVKVHWNTIGNGNNGQ